MYEFLEILRSFAPKNEGERFKNLILDKISKKATLYSYDKDPDAVHYASSIKNNNFKIFHDSFSNISSYHKEQSVDGIIYDLGTCSTHLDNAERGFSFGSPMITSTILVLMDVHWFSLRPILFDIMRTIQETSRTF